MRLLDIQAEQEKKGVGFVFHWITVLLLYAGIMLSFQILLPEQKQFWLLTAIMAAVSGVLLWGFLKRFSALLFPLVDIGVCVGIFLSNPMGFFRSLLYVCNTLTASWNRRYGTYIDQFSMDNPSRQEMFLLLLTVLLLLGLALSYLAAGKKIAVLTAVVFCLLSVSVLTGLEDRYVVTGLLLAGWFCAWYSAAGENTGRLTGIFSGGIFLCLLFGIVFLVFLLPFQPSSVEQIRVKTEKAIHKIRYGEDSLPKGNLQKAGFLLSGEEGRLEVTASKSVDLHLRGFIGSVYNGSHWAQLDYTAYTGEENGILSWLSSQTFTAQRQFASYDLLEKQQKQAAEETPVQVDVKNVGAERSYLYLPATLSELTQGRGKLYQDWQYKSRGPAGETSYAFLATDGDAMGETLIPPEWLELDAPDIGKYRSAEEVYRTFVYKNYLQIDDADRQLMEDVFYSEQTEELKDIYAVTSRIRTILAGLISYTDHPRTAGQSRDYVEDVLKFGREGNAVAFASAAVLAYRAQDIPARYVEGYFLPREKVRDAGEGAKVLLTTQDAHAWVEIYIDGIGWVPVEVTPGFYTAANAAQQYIKMPGDQEQGNKDKSLADNSVEQYDDSRYVSVPEPQTPEQESADQTKSLQGLLWLLLICAAAFWFLMEIRQDVWKRRFWHYLKSADTNQQIYLLFHFIISVMKSVGIEAEGSRFSDSEEAFLERFQMFSPWEYEELAVTIQKGIFGGQTLSRHSYLFVKSFAETLFTEAKRRAEWSVYLRLRYSVRWYRGAVSQKNTRVD